MNTPLAGATIAIATVLMTFDQIDRCEIGTLSAWTQIHETWLLLVVLAGAGIAAQVSMIRRPEEQWARVPATA